MTETTKATYTPGPWHIEGFMGQHGEDGAAIRSNDERRIASTWGGLREMSTPAEWARYHADALLIAAAPELLEALIGCGKMYTKPGQLIFDQRCFCDSYDDEHDDFCVAANAAIAKATGS